MPRSNAARKEEEKPAAQPVRKAMPVRSRRRDIDTREQKVGQDRARAMKSRGPAREALEPTLVEAVESPVSKDKLALLAFMEEELLVMVHDTTNPLDEPFPEVWNDGICQRFQRGQEQTVKRKYVEVLARAKKVAFGNEKYKDAQGEDAYRYPPHSALKYPFSVLQDPSGDRGKAWLKAVLSEA